MKNQVKNEEKSGTGCQFSRDWTGIPVPREVLDILCFGGGEWNCSHISTSLVRNRGLFSLYP